MNSADVRFSGRLNEWIEILFEQCDNAEIGSIRNFALLRYAYAGKLFSCSQNVYETKVTETFCGSFWESLSSARSIVLSVE